MIKGITLFEHQQRLVDKNPDKCLICHETGTGKTITTIALSNRKGKRALFITKKDLVENWQRNLAQFCDVEYKVVSKEVFKRDYKLLSGFDTVVFDECHYVAGMKSALSKTFNKYLRANNVQNIYLASATPYLSTPWNIYTLASHLGYKWSYIAYREKFFVDQYRGRNVFKIPAPNIENDMAKLVSKIGDIVKMEDCIDVPEQTFETEFFALSESQKKAISNINSAGPVEIGAPASSVVSPIVRFTKIHQVENGSLKGDDYTDSQLFDSYKTDRILDLCRDNKKLIIVCRYNLHIESLKVEIEKTGKQVIVINGATKNKDERVLLAESLEDAAVLVNAACSEGYQLPSFPLMVFASLDFSYKNYKQLLGRILRIDKPKKNFYLHLVVSGGVDESVYNAMLKKKDFDTAIYARSLTESVENPEDFKYGLSREELSNGFW